MEFRILGPIEVSSGGQPLQLGGARQRALLAYLLLDANKVVSADRLLDELWASPPAGGVTVLQTQISRLRKSLGDRIVTSGRGYRLHVEPGELDLERFRGLLAEAGATVDPGERSRLLRAADGLWRGEALAGLDAPFAAAEAAALAELRLGALEDRLEADLARGLDGELVSELSSLVTRHPLRERLRGQLILALYRSGRQADALEAYRQTRRMLDQELGLEPSPALRELEGAILRHDPALIPAAAAVATVPVTQAAPRLGRRTALAIAALLAAVAAGAATIRLTRGSGSPQAQLAARTHGTAPHPLTRAHRLRTHARPRSHTATRHAALVSTRHTAPAAATPAVHVLTTAVKPETTTTTAVVTAATTTAPPARTTQAQTKPRTPAHPVPVPVTISDTFDGDQIDGTIWYQIHQGTGWTLDQSNGQLEFTFPPTTAPGGQYNVFGGHVGTQCKFPGDFDARVDFALTQWPAGNGVRVVLWAFFGPTNIGWQAWRWSSSQWGELYGSYTGQSTGVSLDDPSGTLRIARSNGIVTAYLLHRGAWQALTSGRMNELATIAVGADGGPGDNSAFAGQQVVVDFDNFTVTGVHPICPPGSQPPSP